MTYNIDTNNNIKKRKDLLERINADIIRNRKEVDNALNFLKKLEVKQQKLQKELSNIKLSPSQLKTIDFFNKTAPNLKLNDRYLISAKLSTYGVATVKYNELFKTNMLYYHHKYIIQSKNVLDTIKKLYNDSYYSNNTGISISPDISVYEDSWSKKKIQLKSSDDSKYRLSTEYKHFINLKSSKFTFSVDNLENNLRSKDKTVKKMIKTVLNNIVYDK